MKNSGKIGKHEPFGSVLLDEYRYCADWFEIGVNDWFGIAKNYKRFNS